MDKTQFTVVLQNAGYMCDIKDGIPTVHTDKKKVIKEIKSIAKEHGYESSFGIIFDGAVVIPDETTNNEGTIDVLPVELKTKPVEKADKADEILPVTTIENVPADDEEESFDNISSEPSLFDMFADFE